MTKVPHIPGPSRRPRLSTLCFEPENPAGGGAPTVTIEDVARTVNELSTAVQGMAEQRVDEATVQRIVEELMAQQRERDRQENARRGFQPGDLDEDDARTFLQATGPERMVEILGRPAEHVARLIRRPADDIRLLQQAADRVVIVAAILQAQGRAIDPRQLRSYQEGYLPALQAMDATTATEGDEFVPTELSSSLIERVNLELRVLNLWPAVPMPTNPWEIPGKGVTRQRLGRHAEQTADTGQTKIKKVTPLSRKVVLNALKFAGEALVSKELEEDSIIAIMPFIEEELVEYLAADLEDTSINGDADGTHQDSDSTGADDPRANWDGLRKRALAAASVDAANAAPTAALFRSVREKMGKYAVAPQELVHILGISTYLKLLSDANLQTMDKYGAQATLLTGELARLDGIPIVLSEYQRQDLNATGVHDGVTTNRSVALTVFRRGFIRGIRRGVTVEVLKEIYSESDQDALKVSTRQAFESRFPTATERIVGRLYNINAA